MPKLTIDDRKIEVMDGLTVLQACQEAEVEIPYFCYHERLSIAGNCRMCLVEIGNASDLVASCAMTVSDGMVVRTHSEKVHEARKGVMEFLLINHPLDCPICDQGGECDLQDQALAYGFDRGRFEENKRAVEDKDLGPLIQTDMTRCIHCTRCIRFAAEVAGAPELGAIGRGETMEIMPYIKKTIMSEMSGNMIDLCPVGALTSKPYAFTARAWELRHTPSIDVMDAVGAAIRIDTRGREVMRILPILNEDVNEEWISDKARFVYDGLKTQRLDRAYIRKNGQLQPASWGEAISAIAEKLSASKPEKIAAITGDLACAESMMTLKDLMTGLKSPHLDCRPATSWQPPPPQQRGGWLFNSTIAGISSADAILIIGSHPRHEAPIINARIFNHWRQTHVPIALIGEKYDLAYDYQHLGNDPSILNRLGAFETILQNASKPMIIIGQGALCHPSGEAIYQQALAIAEKTGAISDEWNGFNMLHTSAAQVAGLDLNILPSKTGMGTQEILRAAQANALDVLYLLHADHLDPEALKNSCVIYQGSHGDRCAQIADFILPGAAWTEKNTIWVNTEGRPQEARRAIFPPGQARPDWAIIRALMETIGIKVEYDDLDSLRARMIKVAPHFAQIAQVSRAPMPKAKPAANISSEPIASPIDDFYLSNAIARASRIMASCSRAHKSGSDS